MFGAIVGLFIMVTEFHVVLFAVLLCKHVC